MFASDSMLRQIATDECGTPDRVADCAPRFHGAVLFYYYEDLPASVSWYERHLGLTKRFDEGWVVIFELTPGNYIGLVDAREGFLQSLPVQGKSSLIALETQDLDDWYARLRDQDDVRLVQPLGIGSKGLTERFLIADPGGYVIEFFRWCRAPAGWRAGADD
ncbi:VOC family protein [Govanella unica]|uniref:VOC family protein n=1 Tax=Govanella unica TaxID=2975056 RepID=A0A9X3Z7U6_9PROT|nr:VOC family protein [Govania unica]MDA5194552.1 VOC family protein [Govania unica]